MSRINEDVAKRFIQLIEELPQIIEGYGLSKSNILKKAGFNRSTFYNKLRNKSFTGTEMLRITKVINE